MENNTEPATETKKMPETQKSPLSFGQIVKGALKLTANVAEEDKTQGSGNPRQIVDGSLIGTCLVFFAAMLGVQHLDTPLTVASVAFAIAIPPLVCGFLLASFNITDKIKAIPGWLLLEALIITAWIIEALAAIAVLVGIFCVILHISHPASVAFTWAIIATLPLLLIGTFIGLMIYAWVQYKRHLQRIKPEEESTPPPIQPQPALAPTAKPHQVRKRQTKDASSRADTTQQP